jgi:hypothetical protein
MESTGDPKEMMVPGHPVRILGWDTNGNVGFLVMAVTSAGSPPEDRIDGDLGILATAPNGAVYARLDDASLAAIRAIVREELDAPSIEDRREVNFASTPFRCSHCGLETTPEQNGDYYVWRCPCGVGNGLASRRAMIRGEL